MLLIDGDILVYRCLSAAETELEFEPDVWTLHCDHGEARVSFIEALDGLIEKAGVDTAVIALSDNKANWRKEVYPSYKANRKAVRKPLGFNAFRQWVIDTYQVAMKPGLEADDVLGILATKPRNDTIIWSIDKDLMQIPGKHLTPDGIKVVSEVDGDWWFIRQTLSGDPVDGYPGCKGIGAVKAEKIIQDAVDANAHLVGSVVEAAWPAVVEAYDKAGLTIEDAITQARMARILRWNDWNQEKQEVKLWTPPTIKP